MMAGAPATWLRRLPSRPGTGLTLVCFPHAGGIADYYLPLPCLAVGVAGLAESRGVLLTRPSQAQQG
jgi:hypothetical protein